MKRYFSIAGILLAAFAANAQQGTITYTKTVKFEIQLPPEMQAQAANFPKEQKSEFELLFNADKTLFRPLVQNSGDMTIDNGDGMVIKMIAPGANDLGYCDLGANKRLDKRDLGVKEYVVEDTLEKAKWKLTGETKVILGHTCKKATSSKTQKSIIMDDAGGKMEQKIFTDTLEVIAWYAEDMHTQASPEYAGNLPGTVLELHIGDMFYTATKVDTACDVKAIKPPKGKKITKEEFRKEQDAFFKKMEEQNHQGPGPGHGPKGN
jgi:GLPGLI family protein